MFLFFEVNYVYLDKDRKMKDELVIVGLLMELMVIVLNIM